MHKTEVAWIISKWTSVRWTSAVCSCANWPAPILFQFYCSRSRDKENTGVRLAATVSRSLKVSYFWLAIWISMYTNTKLHWMSLLQRSTIPLVIGKDPYPANFWLKQVHYMLNLDILWYISWLTCVHAFSHVFYVCVRVTYHANRLYTFIFLYKFIT